MGSAILASASVSASIPVYVADGYSGSGSTRTLTFSAGAPPTDGSIALALVIINVSTGIAYKNGAYMRLLYWDDVGAGLAAVSGVAGLDFAKVPTWSFVANANDSNS